MDINFIWHLHSKKHIKIEIHVQIKLKNLFKKKSRNSKQTAKKLIF